MSGYTVHTTAPVSEAPGGVVGVTPDGRPDCFYGWGEPAQPVSDCKPHTVVDFLPGYTLPDTPKDDAFLLAQHLRDKGYQVVVTEHDDWSLRDGDAPYCYDWDHSH